ncbi:hypothetical protein PROVALCAL_02760 [Providencia alcalifaciens DSM 30120]|uniref:Uncharacterized protein n=1 Tax=Providencia alcalifaciens DSM 30120 TaxID=520999 RepID=B6XHC2_9GAMM|nr:hypothetical protein PROVALCAL_02760 [Providencia alcalifaciens DSM 30120]
MVADSMLYELGEFGFHYGLIPKIYVSDTLQILDKNERVVLFSR